MRKRLVLIIGLIFITGTLWAQLPPLPPEDSQGLTDQTLLRSDTIHLDRRIMDRRRPDGNQVQQGEEQQQNDQIQQQQPKRKQLGFGIGANMYYSETYNIYTIPVSYDGLEYWEFSAGFPFVIVQYLGDINYLKYGLGDITLGTVFTFPEWVSGLTLSIALDIALPTGDVAAVDKDQNIPLGAGSTLSYFTLSFSQLWNRFRLFGDIGYGFYWYKADYEVEINDVTTRYVIGKGQALTLLLGGEYQLTKWLMINTKVYLAVNTESFIEETTNGIHYSYEANDSLIASDILIGGKANIFKNAAVSLAVSFPIYTLYDEDLDDPEARSWGISAGLTSYF